MTQIDEKTSEENEIKVMNFLRTYLDLHVPKEGHQIQVLGRLFGTFLAFSNLTENEISEALTQMLEGIRRFRKNTVGAENDTNE